MEGGNSVLQIVSYIVVAIILLALLVVTARTLLYVLGLLALPFADTLSRWAPGRRWLERWAARGAARNPDLWRPDRGHPPDDPPR